MQNHQQASLVKCLSYKCVEVSNAVKRSVDLLGGIESYVRPGERILVKINLLGAYTPDKRVTTHPEVVRAVIELVQSAGATPVVGDSPGGINNRTSYKGALELSGIAAVCKETGVETPFFDNDIRTLESPNGKLYRHFRIAGIIHEVDGVIAVPVLKTHGLMRLTCAVKVLFGLVSGLEKAEYHLKVPSRRDFADMLVDLYIAVQPRLAVVDGIVAMEGEGPSHGDPYELGAIIASPDCVAADIAASRLVSIDPLSVNTIASAVARGLVGIENLEFLGDSLDELKVSDFRLPERDLAETGVPFSRRFLKNVVTASPYLHPGTCRSCRTCQQICPIDAISFTNKTPVFDYEKCIRCYCCEELCPEGAIKRRNHWLIKPFIRWLR